MLSETLPIMASLVSTFSRAGLNVVDRMQFGKENACPLALGYWNNFLPVLLLLPMICSSPESKNFISDLFSFELAFLSLLTQCVSYSFSFAFKSLRVTDLAIFSKSADITVPLALFLLGSHSAPVILFLLLPAILMAFIISAGIDAIKKSYQPLTALVFFLTVQGVYAFFVDFDKPLDRGFWGLLSFAFAVLVWRFIFSSLFLLGKHRSCAFIFSGKVLTQFGFYLRGLLTLLTQVSFMFAITSSDLLIVWPILNATGFLGAVFAYFFLSEKLGQKDFLFILFAFLITGSAMLSLNGGSI